MTSSEQLVVTLARVQLLVVTLARVQLLVVTLAKVLLLVVTVARVQLLVCDTRLGFSLDYSGYVLRRHRLSHTSTPGCSVYFSL